MPPASWRRSQEIDAARLYLQIPIPARPVLSYFFDRSTIWSTNPDVAAAGVDPFIHFLSTGVPKVDHRIR